MKGPSPMRDVVEAMARAIVVTGVTIIDGPPATKQNGPAD